MAQGGGALGGGDDGRVRGYSSVGERAQQNRNAGLYDRTGKPVRTVNGNVVAPIDGWYYDANRQPLGNNPQPYLDVNGNVTGYTPGGDQPIYDANGNIIGYSNSNYPGNYGPGYQGNSGQPIYDANGNLTGYSNSGANTRYDANGNPITYPNDQTRYRNVGPFRIRY